MSSGQRVFVTAGAERDLEEIHDYIVRGDSARRADEIQDRLLGLIERLGDLPDRGSSPKELATLGIHEYRQVILRPWRVIYRVVDASVFVLVVADGRRDMQSLLARRLLNP